MTKLAERKEQPAESLMDLFDFLQQVETGAQLDKTTTPNGESKGDKQAGGVQQPYFPTGEKIQNSAGASSLEQLSTVSPPPSLFSEPTQKSTDFDKKIPRRGKLQEILLRLETQEKFAHSTLLSANRNRNIPSSHIELAEKKEENSESQVRETPIPHSSNVQTTVQDDEKTQLLNTQVEKITEQLLNSQEKIQHLESQLYKPTELINPILPLITELLKGKVAEVDITRDEIFHLIVPIIDRVILERGLQDKSAMSRAFSVLIPEAISHHIQHSPDEIANAIGPTMGRAIKEQIRLERDSMVDALYPVIGNTIAKYMGEVVRNINSKVESALSVEGLNRKLRAKMQGVSEAELIMKEALPFQIKAIFLIHKASGLIITNIQKTGDEQLESGMIAGMLTAIRSFANDCFATSSSNQAELSEIEYDSFKIILEVAGYCYLAIVSQGEMPQSFIGKVRDTLGKIVEHYDRAIQNFDGNPDNMPKPISDILELLMISTNQKQFRGKSSHSLLFLIMIVLLIVAALTARTMIATYQEKEVLLTFDKTPELAIYRLEAEASGNQMTLKGKLPNAYLREKAEMTALYRFPGLEFDNQIMIADIPPDPTQTAAEVQRVTHIFNREENTVLTAEYQNRKIFIRGQVNPSENARTVSKAFESIPGVNTLVVAIEQPVQENKTTMEIADRVYFELGSARFMASEFDNKITPLSKTLHQNLDILVKITGHTDATGVPEFNQKLALQRALSVKQALQQQGIAEHRLLVEGISGPPSDLQGVPNSDELSRCVLFEQWFPEMDSIKKDEKISVITEFSEMSTLTQ